MESIVQNGRLEITRRFIESSIIRPDAKVRSLLPVEMLKGFYLNDWFGRDGSFVAEAVISWLR